MENNMKFMNQIFLQLWIRYFYSCDFLDFVFFLIQSPASNFPGICQKKHSFYML